MSKPKSNKNNRSKTPARNLNNPINEHHKEVQHFSLEVFRKKTDKHILLPSLLIVCEGQTEAAYFEGLCAIYSLRDKFVINILPQIEPITQNYLGSSAKGLLYMAIQIQNNATMPYNHIWIVTDNDECNAYILDADTLNRLQNIVSANVYTQLQAIRQVELHVREIEGQDNLNQRNRFFLCRIDYEHFLKNTLSLTDEALVATIIDTTTKHTKLTRLYSQDSKALFYDSTDTFITTNYRGEVRYEERYFDEKWKGYIKIAYTCISFEYWLLLHFERSEQPFLNSLEIIEYFNNRSYFNRTFAKGWYLYEKRNTPIIKAFFRQVHQAIRNNLCLYTSIQQTLQNPPITREFYEINPYSDGLLLSAFLFNITIALPHIPINFTDMRNLTAAKNDTYINISFEFMGKQGVLNKAVEERFNVSDSDENSVANQIRFENNDSIIRQHDRVEVCITLTSVSSPIFLQVRNTVKAETHTLLIAFN